MQLFCIGFLIMYMLHLFSISMYKKQLIDKADAPKKYGGSNVEFIKGEPFVIMRESDYIENCKVWYEK